MHKKFAHYGNYNFRVEYDVDFLFSSLWLLLLLAQLLCEENLSSKSFRITEKLTGNTKIHTQSYRRKRNKQKSAYRQTQTLPKPGRRQKNPKSCRVVTTAMLLNSKRKLYREKYNRPVASKRTNKKWTMRVVSEREWIRGKKNDVTTTWDREDSVSTAVAKECHPIIPYVSVEEMA